MLFRKKIDKFCSYCSHAGKIDDNTKYDPLKRVPARIKPKDFSQYDDVDFSL